jgi:hypothetical protein
MEKAIKNKFSFPVKEECSEAEISNINLAVAHELHGRHLFGSFLVGAMCVASPKLLSQIAKRFLIINNINLTKG